MVTFLNLTIQLALVDASRSVGMAVFVMLCHHELSELKAEQKSCKNLAWKKFSTTETLELIFKGEMLRKILTTRGNLAMV